MSREAMNLALDALENHTAIKHPQQRYYRDRAIDALRAALERGWIDITDGELYDLWLKMPAETEDRFAFVRKALAMQKEKNS